ncbi:MAG: thiamine diphosphokinase [Sulfitobacter sp.]
MSDCIVESADPVTLIGGGEATPQDLQKALTLAPVCVAADGGAAFALDIGVMPEAVIGDFDSLEAETRTAIPTARLHHIEEQESTDFEKALTRIKAPVVLGVGFLGARVDHQLAALHTLVASPQHPCLLMGAHEVICLAPPQISLPVQPGDAVSLFPMGPVTGRSTGLAWPIEGLAFDPHSKIGTSNRAVGPVTLDMDRPAMLLILPRRLTRALLAQFVQPDAARWPARAG